MAVREHLVSNRNGVQVMVAGLKLLDLGYGPGASVSVTDPTNTPGHEPWRFVVSNKEHATLVSRQPEPPAWIQPGRRVRIEVRPVEAGALAPLVPPRAEPSVSASAPADWRRALIRLLDTIERARSEQGTEGVASQFDRLTRTGTIPPEVAALEGLPTTENNPTNIVAAFDMLLEAIDAEIDNVNRVGARAFEGRDYDKAKDALERAAEVTRQIPSLTERFFREVRPVLSQNADDIAAIRQQSALVSRMSEQIVTLERVTEQQAQRLNQLEETLRNSQGLRAWLGKWLG